MSKQSFAQVIGTVLDQRLGGGTTCIWTFRASVATTRMWQVDGLKNSSTKCRRIHKLLPRMRGKAITRTEDFHNHHVHCNPRACNHLELEGKMCLGFVEAEPL